MAGTFRHPNFFLTRDPMDRTVLMKLFFPLFLLAVNSAFLAAQTSSPAQQIQSHEQRAHQLLNEKKPELAVREFAAVIALDPRNLDAQANLGVLLFFQNKYVEAEPHLRAAIEQKPDLTKIRALLGMCEHRLGKNDVAKSDLESVFASIDESNVRMEVGLELVEIYTASGDLTRASAVIEALRQKDPANPKILYAAYRIYTDLAGEAILSLSAAAPDSGQMFQAMAHELSRQGDNSTAIADLRKALSADPNLPGIHYELAEALRASDDQKLKAEAEEQYKLAVTANPSDVKAMTRLGDLAVEKSDLDGATNYYQRALRLAPGDADASIGLARIYMEKDDPSAALPLLERVTAADPTNELAHYRLATVYRTLNRPEDAKREVDTYQKLKAMKEKLRQVYKNLRTGDEPDSKEASSKP
jgi:Tfp pilus assembly protein PilF